MEKDYKASIEVDINGCSITKANQKLVVVYNSPMDNSLEYYQNDPDADYIYVGVEEIDDNNIPSHSSGIVLSVDELEFILKHAQKLIKTLKTGTHHFEY